MSIKSGTEIFVRAGESGKVVRFAHQPPLLLEHIPGTHFSQRLSRSQSYSVAGSIKSLKNPDDHIWNRTCDLADCSAVPQLASILCTSTHVHVLYQKCFFLLNLKMYV
jgi:hypothetical protein